MADEEDDDDLFGDFKFVSSYTNGNTLDFEDQEDDWGDFIDNNTGDKPHHHIQTSEKKIWHKPQGVLPLSIFGDQDDDKFDSNSIDHFFNDSFKNVSTVKNGFNYGSGINLNDLYNQDQSNSDSVNQIVDLDEDGWEFKDASSGEVEVSSIKAAETTTTIITSDNMIQLSQTDAKYYQYQSTVAEDGLLKFSFNYLDDLCVVAASKSIFGFPTFTVETVSEPGLDTLFGSVDLLSEST
ncbi:hypothetical protein GIB67_005812 [Kingdonia uniflora]|uniref:Uncharacterized protein n=1 Tax=Kingdonia uniflora TaxID=39325 RepID=A0A7J7MBA1_9MAGN|nr:hypothetical protein GIB67_005812 [Kingdonia uniflora]